ncbi:MlaD family protein [Rhodococcus sp. G-MC3]|uniref:MlaD family protein n=1 Tax=Rhodococcus sp. G-MC3 TaxID=3046209 RepID=UPI0024B9EE79|nr:MlaD family protein [Rhodococcus sp. G-MC3]MDJ0392672.1 MlaD family protein [Rhodococcus sp. G-MC3]
MLRRLAGSRGLTSVAVVALVAIVALVGAFVLLQPTKERIAYCATMPDSIGLYVGNDVALRGIKVGSVTSLHPDGANVRVDFRVDADHPLRGDVMAATVSDTIVADRLLAVNSTQGALWNPQTCVTTTATPKSITQTLDALTTLAEQLNGGDNPAKQNTLSEAVRELDSGTKGIGPKISTVTTDLASALRNPDGAISDLGSLIDNLSSLSQSVANGWGDLRLMLDGLAPVLELVNTVWEQVITIVDSLAVILPWLNDITTKYGGPIMDLLNQAVPALDLVAANVGTLQKLIDMIPVYADAFRSTADPETGRAKISYKPPRVALATPDAALVCGAINAMAPGRCTNSADGLASSDLVTTVLTLAGARP